MNVRKAAVVAVNKEVEAMKYKSWLRPILFLSIVVLFPAIFVFSQETITITTYYPAPFGVYSNLRLYPGAEPVCANANDEGILFYDRTSHNFRICSIDAWGAFELQDVGHWIRNGSNLYLTNSGWRVGINTDNPLGALDVRGNSGLIVPRIAAHPAGVNGMIYYNTAEKKFKIYEDNTWKNLAGVEMKSGIYKGTGGWRTVDVGFKPKLVMVLPHGQGPEAWLDNLTIKMDVWPVAGVLNSGPYTWTAQYVKDAEGYDNPGGDAPWDASGIRLYDQGFQTDLNSAGRDYSYVVVTW